MDGLYEANVAKTEFREGFNLGDAARILAIADPQLVSFSDGQPSEFGESGLEALEIRLKNLFERFTASLAVIVNEVRIEGDVAYDYGLHDLTLTPKDGGQPIHTISGGKRCAHGETNVCEAGPTRHYETASHRRRCCRGAGRLRVVYSVQFARHDKSGEFGTARGTRRH